ncbi:MAG: nitroreductase family protein [Candidatus Micrarchaeia archaeon]
MDFFELVEKRRSVRSFTDADVEEEKLQKIIDAAIASPSAGNLQAYKIFVVRDKERRRLLSEAALSQEFINEAPVSLVFFADKARSASRYGARGASLYAVQDATIACTFAMLAATELGLGSVWVGAFDDSEVSRVCGAEKDLVPVAILPIGYPSETPRKTLRAGRERLVKTL